MYAEKKYLIIPFLFLVCLAYLASFYLIFSYNYKIDFSSFYSAILALMDGENPYRPLSTTYLAVNELLPTNLNPPFTLWLISFAAQFNYLTALAIFAALYTILGLIAATLSFRYAFPAEFFKKNRLYLYLIYLSFYATMMNTLILQLGMVLFFFIMIGYHFYVKKRDCLAGFCWGIIVAIKLFPALLFFFVLKQRRIKVLITMIVTVAVAFLIPILVYGSKIYYDYFSMITRVLWYADSWNGSIYGFIFRIFVDTHDLAQNLIVIKCVYLSIFLLVLGWYLKKMGPTETQLINHQPFCLTIVMMLLLSPFGWLYYFPVLAFPLALTWTSTLNQTSNKQKLGWLLSLFFINFPMQYITDHEMIYFADRIGIFSFYFYGLLILVYFLAANPTLYRQAPDRKQNESYFIPATFLFFTFSLLESAIAFLVKSLIST